MKYNFDEIRAYRADEVQDVLKRLIEQKPFMKIVSTIFPLMPKDKLREKIASFTNSDDMQREMIYPYLQYLEATQTKGIELKGLENIDTTEQYLFISNHRDIVLDSSFLCLLLLRANLKTVHIAIGDNLLVFPFIKDLVRVNKSFLVQRGLNPRDILESSKRLSAYIRTVLKEDKSSIWMAQREGRAKDSNDRTQDALLKMLTLEGEGNSFLDRIKEVNIAPLTISYEYDPCDYLKAKEFQQKRDNPKHKKSPEDDLINMQTGILGYKGKVIYQISECINRTIDSKISDIKNKNEQIRTTAKIIDNEIHKNYSIFAINRVAYDELTGEKRFRNEYTDQERTDVLKYIDRQIEKIDLVNRDNEFVRHKILEMYANPLINMLNQ